MNIDFGMQYPVLFSRREPTRSKDMGRGNWIPDTPIYQGDYDLVYVELQRCLRIVPRLR